MTALTETLRAELLPLGIRVIEILPGAIATDMLARSEESPVDVDHPSYRPMAERFVELRRPLTGPGVPPAEAARAIVEAICEGCMASSRSSAWEPGQWSERANHLHHPSRSNP